MNKVKLTALRQPLKRIEAIKLVRFCAGLELIESKGIVDSLQKGICQTIEVDMSDDMVRYDINRTFVYEVLPSGKKLRLYSIEVDTGAFVITKLILASTREKALEVAVTIGVVKNTREITGPFIDGMVLK